MVFIEILCIVGKENDTIITYKRIVLLAARHKYSSILYCCLKDVSCSPGETMINVKNCSEEVLYILVIIIQLVGCVLMVESVIRVSWKS